MITESNNNTSTYSDQVWERFKEPVCAGRLDNNSETVTTGISRDPATGHTVRMWLRMDESRIISARFQARGCPVTIAAASMAAETLEGMTVAAARQLSGRKLVARLAAPVEKVSSGLLVEDALQEALKNYKHGPINR